MQNARKFYNILMTWKIVPWKNIPFFISPMTI